MAQDPKFTPPFGTIRGPWRGQSKISWQRWKYMGRTDNGWVYGSGETQKAALEVVKGILAFVLAEKDAIMKNNEV